MKAVPLAASLALHAAAIAAFLYLSPESTPRSPSVSLTVALMPGLPADSASPTAEPAAGSPADSPPTASAPSGSLRGLAIPATRADAPEHLPANSATQAASKFPSVPTESGTAATMTPSANGSSNTISNGSSAAGQGRTGVSIPAHYAAGNKKPEYPQLSRRLEEQGTVVLRVLVREDGRAGKVIIRQSSGHELLDESARAAVETWRFQPATSGNIAIAEWYQIAIPFTLHH